VLNIPGRKVTADLRNLHPYGGASWKETVEEHPETVVIYGMQHEDDAGKDTPVGAVKEAGMQNVPFDHPERRNRAFARRHATPIYVRQQSPEMPSSTNA